jgi:hypothetical protein
VTTQPSAHHLAQALLQPLPCILIALYDGPVQQFETIYLIKKLSTTIRLDFLLALLNERGDTKSLR